ncbi:MAG: DNA-directed RNA polymerase subunit beta' [Bacillales bacterium]|nr:DNA-directed RNA polymerase subunit beta' [Bacillales bacterium]
MSQKYSHLKIRLASPEEIRSWSYGEVLNHETINYRTLKPERGGLFAEEIFGPTKDYQCACSNKSKKNTNIENKKCPICGVEITESKVRRERMGHITLAAPVVHTWYLKSLPSKLALLLDIKSSDLEEVVYLASYIVVEPGDTDLEFKEILSEFDFKNAYEKFGNRFRALTGGEAIKYLLKKIDLEKEVTELRKELKSSSKQKREKVTKRLAVVESFKNSDNKPEWMVLDVLPVIPPDLRPMVQLDGGRFATTDLNDLYRRILNRNNRLKKLYEQNAPHLITKNEKRLLQESVDALIDNSKKGRRASTDRSRPLKSLSDALRGKQGRFRQNLLGKRVDYSGRSVIVVGPNLEMHQCGVPREMALTLFKPFVIHELIAQGISNNVRSAKKLIDNKDDRIWGPLESVVLEHPVLLNRAPTLHRLGIQAFEPILIDGKAIQLHPLACPAFNADFDGDQMAIHIPLSEEAQAEARIMMLASNNILNPKDGKPVVMPSQDMVLGNYYLTLEYPGAIGEGRVFKDINEAEMAYNEHQIKLQSRIALRANSIPYNVPIEHKEDYIITTYGKMIFNSIMSKGFPYLNEPSEKNLNEATPDKYFVPLGTDIKKYIESLPSTEPFKKNFLGKIISETFAKHKVNETSKMLDRLKNLGFHYSTVSGITVSAFDINIYGGKYAIIKDAEKQAENYEEDFENGLLTNEERYKLITDKVWPKAIKKIQDELIADLENNHADNHVFMMYDSGARGKASNYSQLAGLRGLMGDTKGRSIEIPITSCFREGLSMREFFISTHGSRKGSTDTALKTADSGYLTRRLVDVSQDVAIREYDCGTDKGVIVSEIRDKDNKTVESLYDRILGRFAYRDCIDPKTKEVYVKKGEYIDEVVAKKIIDSNIKEVGIRTVCTCNSHNGICVKCYGRNLATSGIVEVGEAVGTIASQSIGEPGTQLTMRTFHTGGVAGGDITQGLPRVQELFEARRPKGEALIAEFTGKVAISSNNTVITVKGNIETKSYSTQPGVTLLVKNGDIVASGQQLTEGSLNLRQLLKATNIETVQQYIIREVQKVYNKEGVGINDKHIEIIVRQMTKRLFVQLEGDTELLPGSLISANHYADANKAALLSGGKPAVATPIILGITKAALRSDSFLSAASFQETTRVLTDAAIAGATDPLSGLKENVIIGGLIPAGTGILKDTYFNYEGPKVESEEEDYSSFDD